MMLIRTEIETVVEAMSILSARAAVTDSATTRAARATAYGLHASALADLETGARLPTVEEAAAIDAWCDGAAVLLRDADGVKGIGSLPLTAPEDTP